jgi:hypothetical protein
VSRVALAITAGVLLLAAIPAAAGTVCVATAAELQAALDAAGDNGTDDVILVHQGSYVAPPPSGFVYSSVQNHDLEVRGGYIDFPPFGCVRGRVDPTRTTLNGNGSDPILSIATNLALSPQILVEGFTFRSGIGQGEAAGGLTIVTVNSLSPAIRVERNVFDHHVAGPAGVTALLLRGYGGSWSVVNNLVHRNLCDGDATVRLRVGAPGMQYIANNTIGPNPALLGACDGLRVEGHGGILQNNILWGNSGTDLVVGLWEGASEFLGTANDIGTVSVDFDTSYDSGGTDISLDPVFLGIQDQRLGVGSPAVNAGASPPIVALPPHDLATVPRVLGTAIDLGAYEQSRMFWSGFEGVDPPWSAGL